jgi:hypothetical protein
MVDLEYTNGKIWNPNTYSLPIPCHVFIYNQLTDYITSSNMISAYKSLFYHFLNSYPAEDLRVIEPTIEDTIKLHINQMHNDMQNYVPSTPFLKNVKRQGFNFLLLDGLIFARFTAIIKSYIETFNDNSKDQNERLVDFMLQRMVVDPLKLNMLVKNKRSNNSKRIWKLSRG